MNTTRQYYYRNPSCHAQGTEDQSCTCWHDEGTGPLADGGATTWREYPPHTPPAAPEGMKWQYRGMGWTNDTSGTRYYALDSRNGNVGDSVSAIPAGGANLHYFEAVPTKEEPLPLPAYPEAPEGMKWEYVESAFVGGLGDYCFLNSTRTGWIRARNSGGFFNHVLKAVPTGYTEQEAEAWKRQRAFEGAIFGDPKGQAAAHKAPLHLLPSFPLHETAHVLKAGSLKYGEFNWRSNKVKASVYRSAMGRHLDQWFDGLEDADAETSRSHLAHVIASACIVMDAMKCGTLIDDRPRNNES